MSPTHYDLYLESGPKRRTTLAHAIQLPGCAWQSPTTDQAIEDAAEMIGRYLHFLARHGSAVDPTVPFTTSVLHEALGGGFLGTAPLPSDSGAMDAARVRSHLDRLEWLRADTLDLVEGLGRDELEAKPPKGRALGRILSHVLGAEYSYLGAGGFLIPGLHALYASAEKGEGDARELTRRAFEMVLARLQAMSDGERTRVVRRSTGPWTVRRMFRRMLEHNWEHYQEMVARPGAAVASGPAGKIDASHGAARRPPGSRS